jgi:8-amino-7-oxononanoate synthase
MLLVDEAHAVGVVSPHGRGLVDELGLTHRIDVQMGTLSKALGGAGGYICGSRELVDLLINRARSFIYSTAPPPALAAAALAAVEFLDSPAGEARRQALWANVRRFAARVPSVAGRSPASAIVPFIVGSEDAALSAATALFEQGFHVPAIRYPTVPRDAARLRVTFSALHSAAAIDTLADAVRSLPSSQPAPDEHGDVADLLHAEQPGIPEENR